MRPLKPLSIIYNEKSGFHASKHEDVYVQLMTVFTEYGFEIQVFELNENTLFDDLINNVIHRHSQNENTGVVVAAGGDGTLNAVATKLKNTSIPMGILPLGTFNYVAKVLEIPLDLLEAAEVIATGKPRSVHVAAINDHIYLNNASLGLYPLFIKKRELYNKYLGRLPLHAYTSALDVLLRENKSMKLSITVDGKKYPVKAPLIFFGNNQLQLCDMKLRIAECAAQGRVAGVVITKSDKLSLLNMLWQWVQGKVEDAQDVYSFCADHVIVECAKKTKLTVALDGEIIEMKPPLNFTVEKNALNIMVPNVTTSV
ncbi:diacylglycerol kinase [Acinetobacter baumannii]|uniref:diacylglycerol/lipid kinase family protein n=1 Tax=Acinetobacter baumannii TaxID=470 RepID=UPI0029410D1B|nr:diacylglycerol kinase family protein [Acinetobacter baumannii]MDV4272363.1 diacylglycerol kinase [Acinetobacter baumannii]